MGNILSRTDLQESANHFTRADRASRLYSAYAAQCLRRYGDQGPQVSMIVRDHFPESSKNRLRGLACAVGKMLDAAWQAKPARVKINTMFKLRHAIIERDNRRLYG